MVKFGFTSIWKKSLILAGASLCVISMTACPAKPKKARTPVIKKVFMGNPSNIYAGAKTNPALDPSVFPDGGMIYIHNITQFARIDEYNTSAQVTQQTLEQESAASDAEDSKSGNIPFSVRNSSAQDSSILLTPAATQKDFENLFLQFKIAPTNSTQTTQLLMQVGADKTVCNLVHFSRTADKQQFSVMADCADADGQNGGVLVIHFTTKEYDKMPEVTDKTYASRDLRSPFYFVLGPGYLLTHDQRQVVQVNICGALATAYADQIKKGINKWQEPLRGRLNIEINIVPNNFAPFSDLHQKCIYVIDDLMTEPNPSHLNYGATYTLNNSSKADILDADILIFAQEFLKVNNDITSYNQKNKTTFLTYGNFDSLIHIPAAAPQNENEKFAQDVSQHMAGQFDYTIAHEFGHFLGLDHQFDRVPSIMSYDMTEENLTDYDVQAIQTLYPLAKKTQRAFAPKNPGSQATTKSVQK